MMGDEGANAVKLMEEGAAGLPSIGDTNNVLTTLEGMVSPTSIAQAGGKKLLGLCFQSVPVDMCALSLSVFLKRRPPLVIRNLIYLLAFVFVGADHYKQEPIIAPESDGYVFFLCMCCLLFDKLLVETLWFMAPHNLIREFKQLLPQFKDMVKAYSAECDRLQQLTKFLQEEVSSLQVLSVELRATNDALKVTKAELEETNSALKVTNTDLQKTSGVIASQVNNLIYNNTALTDIVSNLQEQGDITQQALVNAVLDAQGAAAKIITEYEDQAKLTAQTQSKQIEQSQALLVEREEKLREQQRLLGELEKSVTASQKQSEERALQINKGREQLEARDSLQQAQKEALEKLTAQNEVIQLVQVHAKDLSDLIKTALDKKNKRSLIKASKPKIPVLTEHLVFWQSLLKISSVMSQKTAASPSRDLGQ